MNNKITNKIYQPILYFFLLPVLSLIFGTFFASKYGNLRFAMLLFFYLFILTNQLIENILLRVPNNDFELSKKLLIVLEIVNFSILLLFTWQYSIIAGLILFLYTLIIQVQFLFSYYDLEKTAAFIASFLKVILLNSFAFYLHTEFLSLDRFSNYAVILIPYFIYELTRLHNQKPDQSFKTLGTLSFIIALLLLWQSFSYFSLLFLVSLPVLSPLRENLTRKNASFFLFGFAFFYGLLLILSLIL